MEETISFQNIPHFRKPQIFTFIDDEFETQE